MDCIIASVTIENNKYHVDSVTLRFFGAPTAIQAILTAKKYGMGSSLRPDYNNPNFEVHMRADGDETVVQFHPCVKIKR